MKITSAKAVIYLYSIQVHKSASYDHFPETKWSKKVDLPETTLHLKMYFESKDLPTY